MKLRKRKKNYATFADNTSNYKVTATVPDKWKSQDGKGIKSMGGRHEHKTCYK